MIGGYIISEGNFSLQIILVALLLKLWEILLINCIQVYHQYGVGSHPLCKLQKWCTRLAVAGGKDYQLLSQSRWFSPGTPASSTTKAGRHDIAEILLKVALKHHKSNQIKSNPYKIRIQTSDYRFERHFHLYRDGVFYWWRKPE
jgi:hypothetical protein